MAARANPDQASEERGNRRYTARRLCPAIPSGSCKDQQEPKHPHRDGEEDRANSERSEETGTARTLKRSCGLEGYFRQTP